MSSWNVLPKFLWVLPEHGIWVTAYLGIWVMTYLDICIIASTLSLQKQKGGKKHVWHQSVTLMMSGISGQDYTYHRSSRWSSWYGRDSPWPDRPGWLHTHPSHIWYRYLREGTMEHKHRLTSSPQDIIFTFIACVVKTLHKQQLGMGIWKIYNVWVLSGSTLKLNTRNVNKELASGWIFELKLSNMSLDGRTDDEIKPHLSTYKAKMLWSHAELGGQPHEQYKCLCSYIIDCVYCQYNHKILFQWGRGTFSVSLWATDVP